MPGSSAATLGTALFLKTCNPVVTMQSIFVEILERGPGDHGEMFALELDQHVETAPSTAPIRACGVDAAAGVRRPRLSAPVHAVRARCGRGACRWVTGTFTSTASLQLASDCFT